MHRFFFKNVSSQNISFDKKHEIFHQIKKVFRAKNGDKYIFFDGEFSEDFIFEISEILENGIKFKFLEKIKKVPEKTYLKLFSAIPNKIEKIEFVLQNGTQIGIDEFIFFKSDFSQKLIIPEKKLERFEKIILESVEQSGRNKIPKLKFVEKFTFEELIGEKYFCHTNSENSIELKNISKSEKYSLIIGPEGGFSLKEEKEFLENSVRKINLGENILRTETASISVSFFIKQMNL